MSSRPSRSGLPLLAAYLDDRTAAPELFTGTQVLASCFFACTGLLCLVGWRLVGYARSAYIGGSFAFLGILTAPLPLVGDLLPDGSQPGAVRSARKGSHLPRRAVAGGDGRVQPRNRFPAEAAANAGRRCGPLGWGFTHCSWCSWLPSGRKGGRRCSAAC